MGWIARADFLALRICARHSSGRDDKRVREAGRRAIAAPRAGAAEGHAGSRLSETRSRLSRSFTGAVRARAGGHAVDLEQRTDLRRRSAARSAEVEPRADFTGVR